MQRVPVSSLRFQNKDGSLGSIAIWREGERDYYHATYGYAFKDAPLDSLTADGAIDLDSHQPVAPPALLPATQPLAEDSFVKKVQWATWSVDDSDAADLLLNEAEIMHLIAAHPHPNIVEYRGYLPGVDPNRIGGLVFERHPRTLRDALKSANADDLNREAILADVKSAIEHLHLLGIVHNDLSYNNVMLAEDGRAVVIDFDAACLVGSRLGSKIGSAGFVPSVDPTIQCLATTAPNPSGDTSSDAIQLPLPSSTTASIQRIAAFERDLYALDRLEAYLNGEENVEAKRARRQNDLALWAALVESGKWSVAHFERMKARAGYDDAVGDRSLEPPAGLARE